MVVTKLARVYAKALLDLAVEQDQVEPIKADMDLVAGVIKESPELAVTLSSPIIKTDKKSAIMKEIFNGKVSDITMRFFDVVLNHGREGALYNITRAFENMYLDLKGIEKVEVTTAYPLSDSELKDIREKAAEYTGKQIELVQKVDDSILGGVVLRIRDQRYNGSLAHQLATLRRQFKNNQYIKDF